MIKDRGSKKWTAMMLPEHKKWLETYAINQKKKKMPELDEQQIEEIGWKLQEALENKTPVDITLFGEFQDRTIVGIVSKVDTQLMRVKIEMEDDEFEWVNIGDIIASL